MSAPETPRLRLAWLTELGVEMGRSIRVPLAVTARPQSAPDEAATPSESENDEVHAIDAAAAAPSGPDVGSTPDAPPPEPDAMSPTRVEAAPTPSAAPEIAVGQLVCRVYRQSPLGKAWLVAVDAAELGSEGSAQRLFLGRMLRACDLRRTDVGRDVDVLRTDDERLRASIGDACEDEPVHGVLLIGSLATAAVQVDIPTDSMVSLGRQTLPVVCLPPLVEISTSAQTKAAAWRILCELRARL